MVKQDPTAGHVGVFRIALLGVKLSLPPSFELARFNIL